MGYDERKMVREPRQDAGREMLTLSCLCSLLESDRGGRGKEEERRGRSSAQRSENQYLKDTAGFGPGDSNARNT